MLTVVKAAPEREMEEVSVEETFGIKLKKARTVKAFKEKGDFTPEIDPHYQFPREELVMFLMGLSLDNTIFLQGHSGTGKTELVKQVAARLNYNLMQINFDGHLTRADLVGEPELKAGETGFRYGLIPQAFNTPGTLVLLDEVDACPPETAFVLQRAISEDRKFLLMETNEVYPLHPQNKIVGTANTVGQGDDTGLYTAGTNIQNYSFMNRWQMILKLDYLSKDAEKKMLADRFPKVNDNIINGVVNVLETARTAYKNNELAFPLTTRDAVNWLEKISFFPLPMKAAKISFLHKMTIEDARVVGEAIQRWFTLPKNDDQSYDG